MSTDTSTSPSLSLPLAWLPFAIFILATVGVGLSYLLSARYGWVPWCNPYWDSCSSISAAGRHPPAFFVFKAMLLPVAGLMLVYWYLVAFWLRSLQSEHSAKPRSILVLGCVAATALALYTTMLGAVGDLYQLQRRIGIILFFGLTALCHLLMVARLYQLPRTVRPEGAHWQLLCTLLLLAGGLANSALALAMGDNFDQIEDAMEWIFATVMISQFLLTGLMWARQERRLVWVNEAP